MDLANMDCSVIFAIHRYQAVTGKDASGGSIDIEHLEDVDLSWLLGIGLFLGGCLSNVIGLNLITRAHAKVRVERQLENGDGEDLLWNLQFKRKRKCIELQCEPLYVSGWVLVSILTAVLDMAAIYFAPIAILAPMSGFTVLFNMLIARHVNNEKARWLDLLIAAFIFAGTSVVVIYGPHESPTVTPKMMGCRATRPGFLAFEATSLLLFGACFIGTRVMYNHTEGDWQPNREFAQKHPMLAQLRPLTHLVLGGGFGGQQMLCTKLLMGCLHTSIFMEHAMFETGYPYILIALLLLTGVLQLKSLNRGLNAEGALISVPIYNTAFMVFTMFTSVVFNQTFDTISAHQSIMLLLGLCFVVTGLLLILRRTPTTPPVGVEEAGGVPVAVSRTSVALDEEPMSTAEQMLVPSVPSRESREVEQTTLVDEGDEESDAVSEKVGV